MSGQPLPLTGCNDRRQQLAELIKTHALAARAELLDPVRVRNAIACGKSLMELRELLGYGDRTVWVEKQCGLNRMTANRYIRLARHTGELEWHLSIREAYFVT